MNIYKLMNNMKFSSCVPHRREFSLAERKNVMVPDIYEKKYEKINGTLKLVLKKKYHHKWQKFFKNVIGNYTIWVKVDKDIISNIWVENENNNIEIIVNNLSIKSKLDFVNIFPKEVRRDLIINNLFN